MFLDTLRERFRTLAALVLPVHVYKVYGFAQRRRSIGRRSVSVFVVSADGLDELFRVVKKKEKRT